MKKTGEDFHLRLTVEIESQTSKLLRFLELSYSQKARLNGEPAVYNLYIETYLKFLKMKAKYPHLRLVPSLEVEWVWYSTHSLSFGVLLLLPSASSYPLSCSPWRNQISIGNDPVPSSSFDSSLTELGHLLRPRYYEAYCNKVYGNVIPHSLDDWLLGHEDPEQLNETAKLYEEVSPGISLRV